MKKYILLSLFIYNFCYALDKADFIFSYVVSSGNGEKAHPSGTLKELDLGEGIERLELRGRWAKDIIIEQRFRSSLGVQNEGPHLDFTDWKHGYTEWKALERNEKGDAMVLPTPTQLPFPEVTHKQILDYFSVYKKKDKSDLKHWDAIIENCKSAVEDPCHVGADQIEFRFKKDRKIIKKAQVSTPMGC